MPAARDLYRQCVDEDPGFAPAWARLGRCHRVLAKYDLDRPAENLARADEAFRRALELDPELPVANKVYAHREAETGRARDAMVRLLRLAGQNGNDPEIFAGLVHACRYCGLLEASEAAHREARRLDPHISTSVVYTWWARGEMERVIAETSDADDFELRTMALEALGRPQEARRTIERPVASVAPVFGATLRALRLLIERRPEAAAAFAELAARHTDPEALFMYGSCQARGGDGRGALVAITSAVEGGFTVPQALREHPWLEGIRDEAAAAGVVARAEAARREALRAFLDAGGPALLGC